jgi:hypothetical protein
MIHLLYHFDQAVKAKYYFATEILNNPNYANSIILDKLSQDGINI